MVEEFVFREENAENVGGGVLERAVKSLVEETVAAGRVRKEAFHSRPLNVLLDKVPTADGTGVSANLCEQLSCSSIPLVRTCYLQSYLVEKVNALARSQYLFGPRQTHEFWDHGVTYAVLVVP